MKFGADWPNVPHEGRRFLEHRKRRVRRRALVRLCRRFRQWCRLIKGGAIPMKDPHRQHYEQFAQQPIALLVQDELESRIGLDWHRGAELHGRTAVVHLP